MITDQTADKTFRMLYTATNNADYLTQANEETASDIQLIDTYFLSLYRILRLKQLKGIRQKQQLQLILQQIISTDLKI